MQLNEEETRKKQSPRRSRPQQESGYCSTTLDIIRSSKHIKINMLDAEKKTELEALMIQITIQTKQTKVES